ncbi:MAG: PLP-dependent aminotransferase family protein [Candidatus Cloacimonetes bacterium]|jgi:2-aminoadipate transaminase|nr:PLP-dependent aminotransferase family protein [Candidatus Cloacimonadota bacterium]MDY0173457.1 PLP-dependent aminotransferase family protein [Candidatus Cloacimonadaceae bacterium]
MIYEKMSQATKTMKSSMIRELVASTKNIEGLISFAGGFPSPKTFPREILSKLYHDVVLNEGETILQYGGSQGDSLLATELLKWEGYDDLSTDQILITAGATNAIFYMCAALLEPGDVILCEAPSFLGSLVGFEAMGAELHAIPLDQEGLDMDALGTKVEELKKAGKKIKFIYTIPDFHNPTGVTMSLRRRKKLIEFALAMEIPILEDNPYAQLRYSGESLPSLFRVAHDEYSNTELVTEVVTFSKILGPGMRLGYVKGSKVLIERMCSWQQKVNIAPDNVSQRVAARFLIDGHMEPHLQSIRDFYQPYLAKMLQCMSDYLPAYIQYSKPEGGIFTWLWLPQDMSADLLFEQAKAHKVTFIPGSKFYPVGQEKFNCLRLNFSYSSLEQIDQGIRSLGKLMEDFYT